MAHEIEGEKDEEAPAEYFVLAHELCLEDSCPTVEGNFIWQLCLHVQIARHLDSVAEEQHAG